jgi:hypothetical protein
VTNCFLIREPREMLTSLVKHLPQPTLADTGLPQQVEIFEWARARAGAVPPVLDAREVLQDPHRLLGRLCAALRLEFTDAMLSWPPGRRDTDGVWAKHWYGEVEQTTSFAPYRPKADALPAPLAGLYAECVPYYERLYHHRLS